LRDSPILVHRCVMEFDNSFEVPLPPDQAWRVLMEIERIAPCMPGARLTEKIDDRTYKGTVAVRLGPVALSFAGTAHFEEVDIAARTARVKANGTDSKGRGGANSTVTFRIETASAGAKVLVHTDLAMSGSVAQYGRGAGMIQAVAAQLIKQFATNLQALIDAEPQPASAPDTLAPAASTPAASTPDASAPDASPPDASPPEEASPMKAAPPPAVPISGFGLVFRALWSAIRRLFGAA